MLSQYEYVRSPDPPPTRFDCKREIFQHENPNCLLCGQTLLARPTAIHLFLLARQRESGVVLDGRSRDEWLVMRAKMTISEVVSIDKRFISLDAAIIRVLSLLTLHSSQQCVSSHSGTLIQKWLGWDKTIHPLSFAPLFDTLRIPERGEFDVDDRYATYPV